MDRTWKKALLLLALAASLLAQGAATAETAKAAKQDATYRQVTGEVVSLAADKIAIRAAARAR